jgi:hypothetical protein
VTAIAPARPSTLIGRLSALRIPKPGKRTRSWAVKAAEAAKEHLTTICALGAVDLGAFEACHPAGWIVTGVSLLIAEWKIRAE